MRSSMSYKFRRPTIGQNCSAVCTNKGGHNYIISAIRLVTQRPEAVASRAKQSKTVDLQLTNQIPDLQYLTIPYNTYNTYITL